MMTQGSVLSNAALANALLGGGANVGPYGSTMWRSPTGRLGFGLTAKPALALRCVYPGCRIVLRPWSVVDLLALGAAASLEARQIDHKRLILLAREYLSASRLLAFVVGRSRMHGGLSTGAKTPEGRQRIREAQRRRWERDARLKQTEINPLSLRNHLLIGCIAEAAGK